MSNSIDIVTKFRINKIDVKINNALLTQGIKGDSGNRILNSIVNPDYQQIAKNGDYFLNHNNCNLYEMVDNQWIYITCLKGEDSPAPELDYNLLENKPDIVEPTNSDWNATSGMAMIMNKPALFSGSYQDLDNTPSLSSVATTGNYNDLQETPLLSSVSYSGDYNDLVNNPSLFSGNYSDLTGKPSLFSGNYQDLINKPVYSVVSTTGSYMDLLDKPLLFSGDYNDLINRPFIPSSQINSDWNASSGISEILNKPLLFSGYYQDLMNKPYIFSGIYDDLSNKPLLFSGNYQDLIGKPSLFSGSYNDLSNKPVLFDSDYNKLNNKPVIPVAQVNSDWNATSGLSQILNKPVLFNGDYNNLTNKPIILIKSKTIDLGIKARYFHLITIEDSDVKLSSKITSIMHTPINSEKQKIDEDELEALIFSIRSIELGKFKIGVRSLDGRILNKKTIQYKIIN